MDHHDIDLKYQVSVDYVVLSDERLRMLDPSTWTLFVFFNIGLYNQ